MSRHCIYGCVASNSVSEYQQSRVTYQINNSNYNDTTMRTANNVVWRRVGNDSVVLLDLETGCYNSLNCSGAIVLGAIVRGENMSGCAQVLQQHYPDLTAARANEVVRGFVETMQQRGLLVEGEPDRGRQVADLDLKPEGKFQAPVCEEHQALQEVTAGTYYYTYTYYYYYYY